MKTEDLNKLIHNQSAEHDFIINYVQKFDTALAENDLALLAQSGNELAEMLGPGLQEHFLLEEQIFFPAFLISVRDITVIRTILELQKEHGILEKEAVFFTTYLDQVSIAKALENDNFLRKFKGFFHRLKKHAATEMRDLFPLLEEHRECLYYVRQYANEVTVHAT